MSALKRALSVITIFAVSVSLTGCGAGLNASTRQISQVTDGVEAYVNNEQNNIRVVNLLVVATADQNAVLVGTIVNAKDEPDTLLGVAINGNVATLTGTTTLLRNAPVIFEGDSANAKSTSPGFTSPAGSRVQVTLFFARAGEITVDALVREATDIYANVTSGSAVSAPAAATTETATETE
jgi:copper(I)-binding protein